ncbi:MAG: hypothetical protein ACO1OY_04640 [Ramlibacter sp.]|jgi:hypothetical protein
MVELTRTELDFLQRLLLDLQQEMAARGRRKGDDERVAAIELALALLHWDGALPPGPERQLGLGAAVQMKLGADAMVAYRQWRTELRRRLAREALSS